jgi:phosphohistidine swiveling domain-containing protein
MSAPAAAALLALLLSTPAGALDPRLAAAPELEPGSFSGLTLSMGPGRSVCARVTFDRRKAAAGGLIFATDAGEPGDEDAIRLSEAVIARRGGLTSRAAIAARRHGVPAVALGRGSWDASIPALTLREPVFGPAAAGGGLSVRPAGGEREVILSEDSAACVDAAAGRVAVLADAEAEPRLAAAAAGRAFDGLRDEPALERWLEAAPDEGRAAALMRELAPRALAGGISSEDLARAESAARAAAGPGGRGALEAATRRAWSRAVRAGRANLADCAGAAADAPAGDVLDRLTGGAKAVADRAAAAGRILGGGDGGLGALSRACAAAAAKRRKSVPPASPSLDDAAAAAGASRTESSALPPGAWRSFAAENGLDEFLARTLDDASLGLRRKSERVREKILAGRLDENTATGRLILTSALSGPALVVGDDATLKAAGARELFAAVREVWAASWGAGPLGARLRAGRGADYAGTLRVSRVPKADLSGLLFSRDPGSGRRRVLVEAAPGGIDGLLSGGAAADRYSLEPRSGRVLESVPAAPDGKPLLGSERLKKLARLARALDAWRGGAVEAAFSFDGDTLTVHHARPLEPLRPPQPLNDPFSPRPAPEALNVKPAR